MKICSIHDQQPFNAELTTNHDASIPGSLAIKRLDTGDIIALRDVIGILIAPGSTVKYQLLEVTDEEREKLGKEGFVIAEKLSDCIKQSRDMR